MRRQAFPGTRGLPACAGSGLPSRWADATRLAPVRLARSEVAGGPGGAGPSGTALAWPILDPREARAVRADLTRLAADADEEWLPFGHQGIDFLPGRHKDDLCIAVSDAAGEAKGYLIVARKASVGGASEAPHARYAFVLERVYLVPGARGTGLSSALVAVAAEVFALDLASLDEVLGHARRTVPVSVAISGEGVSVAGVAFLLRVAEELSRHLALVRDGARNAALGELVADLDTSILGMDGDGTPSP